MLYVFRCTIGAGSGKREAFEVFSDIQAAKRMYIAAGSKMRPNGPIVTRAMYQIDTSDKGAAIEAVKAGTAPLLDVGNEPKPSRDEPSLVELLDRLTGTKGSR